MEKLMGRPVFPGVAEGEVILCPDSIQGFLGIAASGVIVEKGHPEEGKNVKGKILVMPSSKGSIAWAMSFKQVALEGNAPLAWAFTKIDSKCATAAVSLRIPAVADFKDADPCAVLKTGDIIRLDGNTGVIEILKKA